MKSKKMTSQTDPSRNTNSDDSVKQPMNQLYKWQFTLKSKVEPEKPEIGGVVGVSSHSTYGARLKAEIRALAALLNGIAKEWYVQLEEGEKTGYRHYQGCMSLIHKEYKGTVINIMGLNAHIEPAKDWNALKAYSTKNETRIEGPWSHKSVFVDTITDLYPWQQEVVDLVTMPCTDDRKIHWFFDEDGCKGKTQLCKYLHVFYDATILNNGKFSDLAYALPDDPKIVCLLLPRTVEGRVNYSAIESIKDGLIFSAKYESGTKCFNSPHVIVMANFLPDESALSRDRWNIHYMYNEDEDVCELDGNEYIDRCKSLIDIDGNKIID